MEIEIRNDCAIIDGYVNAVGRDSRPIMPKSAMFPDKCVEQIVPGAFKMSLENRAKVDLLINHDKNRQLGSTEGGGLTLKEDSIGLRAHAVITDPAAIEKARNGEFVGWSFGMFVNGEEREERAGDIPRRKVTSLDVFEVSLIDRTMQPCYAGTSVECRADGETVSETRSFEDTAEIINNVVPPDFSEWEKKLAAFRALEDISKAEKRLSELRYNPYHDPTNGRFTTADGGGMSAVLHVPMGGKGKGEYVFSTDTYNFEKMDEKIEDNAQFEDAKHYGYTRGAKYVEYTDSKGKILKSETGREQGGTYKASYSSEVANYAKMSTVELQAELKKQTEISNENYWKFGRQAASRVGSFVLQMGNADVKIKQIRQVLRRRK